ncbi:MAG: class I SAM-dependent methyltransferase [Candidatus Binatia bacterium]
MKEGHASRTAEYMALFRALESSRPPGRRLFEDPLARHFLSPPLALVARLSTVPGIRKLLSWFIDRRWPGARSSAVARTRFIDDAVIACLQAHIEQVVILGAGFDSRAYRLHALKMVAVFEVDHPDTLKTKRGMLDRALSGLPERVRFVPTDFNQRQLEQAMAAAGYRNSVPTLFLWEGVTNYLTEAAVDATLRWCSRAAPGSQLVFTYVHRAVLDDPRSFFGTEKLLATLAASGEKWTFGIDPAAVSDFLAQRGLTLERDLGAEDYRRLYFKAAARGMRGYEFYRIVVARVPERAVQPQ